MEQNGSNRPIRSSSQQRPNSSSAGRPASRVAGGAHSAPKTKQKKKSGAMAKWQTGCALYIVLILIISLILSYFVLTRANDMFAFIKPEREFSVTVTAEDDVGSMAKKFKEEGAISYSLTFKLYAGLKKIDELEPGEYTLNTNATYSNLLGAIKKKTVAAARETVKVTIPEGYELRQIVELLDKEGVCGKDELMDTINNYDFKHEFLRDVPKRENRLEGYLFPDTYIFYKNDSGVSVINKMLNNFNDKYTQEFEARAAELGLTTDEVITLASMVEREAANDEERGLVSSVFHNRLTSSQYPYLQSCATVQYILQERKPVLSTADTEINNPYNTYKNKGLPPGPIASPGVASIKAALWPDSTDYMFFVANPGKASLFAKTYDEHLANIKKVGQ